MTSCQLCTDLLESKKGIIEEVERVGESGEQGSLNYPSWGDQSKCMVTLMD